MPGPGEYVYENLWRTAYEKYAAYAWVTGSLVSFILGRQLNVPSGFYLPVSGVMFGFGLFRISQAFDIWNFQDKIRFNPIRIVNILNLIKKSHANDDSLFIGWGFDWQTRHTQRIYQLKQMDTDNIEMPPFWYSFFNRTYETKSTLEKEIKEEDGGALYIHGVDEEKETHIPIKYLKGHSLVLGTTGAGKTRFMEVLISSILHKKDNSSVIVIDPKGDIDLARRLQLECARRGTPEDFLYFHLGHATKSVRIDPLKNWTRSTQIASRIAALIPSETGADAFVAFSWRALDLVVSGLIENNEAADLKTLKFYMEDGVKGLLSKIIIKYLDLNAGPNWKLSLKTNKKDPLSSYVSLYLAVSQTQDIKSDAIEGLIAMYEHSRDHFLKMVAGLLPVLEMLTAGETGRLLCAGKENENEYRPKVDLAQVIETKKILYVGLDSLSDPIVGSAVGSLFLSDLTAVAGNMYNYKSQTQIDSTYLFVDESAECVNEPFIQMLNKGRGAGFIVFFMSQTINDFIAGIGDESRAKQMLGNANNVITLRVIDPDTQLFVSESLGETVIKTTMHTQNTTAISNRDVSDFTAGYGERLIDTDVPIFDAPLLGKLPNLQFLAKLASGKLIKGRLPFIEVPEEEVIEVDETPWLKVAAMEHKSV